jgi:hypothetical protein
MEEIRDCRTAEVALRRQQGQAEEIWESWSGSQLVGSLSESWKNAYKAVSGEEVVEGSFLDEGWEEGWAQMKDHDGWEPYDPALWALMEKAGPGPSGRLC